MGRKFLDEEGLSRLWQRIKSKLDTKADLVDGKVPIEQLPESVATKTDLENVVAEIDESLLTAIGSGVLE